MAALVPFAAFFKKGVLYCMYQTKKEGRKMAMAPNSCPACGAVEEWKLCGIARTTGFGFGKKVGTYYCMKCRFKQDYRILAPKDGCRVL